MNYCIFLLDLVFIFSDFNVVLVSRSPVSVYVLFLVLCFSLMQRNILMKPHNC